jgi:hypothetical protein
MLAVSHADGSVRVYDSSTWQEPGALPLAKKAARDNSPSVAAFPLRELNLLQ